MLNVNFDTATRLADAQSTDEGPRLDPTVPVFWVVNGSKQLKNAHRVLFCGGWAADADAFDGIVRETGRAHHTALEEFEILTREGRDLRCYGAQHLLIAPIAARSCWYLADSKAVLARFEPGARQWVQRLVLLGERRGDQIVSWGAVCLSAKGFQSKNLSTALTAWDKYTSPFRVEITRALADAGQWPDPRRVVPASLFWAPIGTFSNVPESVMVGKTGAQSPITPVRCYTEPGKLTAAILESLYIGDAALAEAALVLDAHTDWLAAWRNQTNGNGHSATPIPDAAELAEAVAPF